MTRRHSAELLERAERLATACEPSSPIVDPSSAARVAWGLLAGRDTEALVCIALSRRRHVDDVAILTQGCDGFTIVDPKQVYRWALTRKRPCSAIILAHNHPSGNAAPSQQDIDCTATVERAGRILGVPLLDHLVITDDPNAWTSLAALGHCSPVATSPAWTA